jgi:hypothetical protein
MADSSFRGLTASAGVPEPGKSGAARSPSPRTVPFMERLPSDNVHYMAETTRRAHNCAMLPALPLRTSSFIQHEVAAVKL